MKNAENPWYDKDFEGTKGTVTRGFSRPPRYDRFDTSPYKPLTTESMLSYFFWVVNSRAVFYSKFAAAIAATVCNRLRPYCQQPILLWQAAKTFRFSHFNGDLCWVRVPSKPKANNFIIKIVLTHHRSRTLCITSHWKLWQQKPNVRLPASHISFLSAK